MDSQTGSDATQRDATDQSQRDTDSAQATQRAAGAEGQEVQRTVSYESHQKLLNEKKTIQARLEKFEAAEKATMTEAERLTAERKAFDEERATFARERRQTQAMNAAQKAGALAPDAVARLIADDQDDLEKGVRDVQKAYPFMFSRGSADGGAGNGNGQAAQMDMNSLIRNRISGRN